MSNEFVLCRRRLAWAACLGVVGLSLFAAGARAQAPAPLAPGAQAQPAIPDALKLSMLIRTTLIALSQANQTGNYSVLRDLGTPQFQFMNNNARLAEIFSTLRTRNLDFSPVLYFDPQLQRPPAYEGSILRLTGIIPTKPQRIVFDMGFEMIGDTWRLSAIVIDVQPAPADSASVKQPDKAAPKPEANSDPTKRKPKAVQTRATP